MAESKKGSKGLQKAISFVHFCTHCKIPEADKNVKFKVCGKCKGATYCSRECQVADWKDHKERCEKNLEEGTSKLSKHICQTPLPSHTKGLSVIIEKPFHRLNDKTWLHGRSEEDVFKILVDCYRLRLQDDSSAFGGPKVAPEKFIDFLRLAGRRKNLLPDWWSVEKSNQCVTYGIRNDVWSTLKKPVTKAEIIEHYGHPYFPMQPRLFGEQVYGTGPCGQPGAGVIKTQMLMENGEQNYFSGMDISSLLRQMSQSEGASKGFRKRRK